jgi:TonB family protein
MATQASDSVKLRSRASAADELAVIVQRAQAFTNANGAAIAVSEGNSDEIVCRARSGASAPDVGTALRVEGTFTGICIQSGKELRCDDAETDTRVDTAAIRSLGIRSMVVTPIKEDGKVAGVLAVFAPTPHAFTITHVAVLKTMADQIAAFLQKERRAREEGHLEPPVSMPKPPMPAASLPAMVIKPAAPSGGNGAAAAVAPARAFPSSTPKVEPIRPLPVASEIAPAVPAPRKEREEKRTEFKPFDYKPPELKSDSAPVSKASLGTLDAVAAERQKAGPNKLILVGAIVAVLAVAGAVFGFVKMRKGGSATSAQAVQQPAQNPAPATQPVATAATPAAPTASTSSESASVTPNTKPDRSETKRAEAENRRNDSSRSDQPSKQTPATVMLATNTGSKISAASAASQPPSQDVAPTFGVGSGSSSQLSSLAAPEATVKPAMVAQSNLVNAKPLRQVPAVYPEIAKSRRLSGVVVVKVTVKKDGKVSNPTLVSGPTIFRDAAFDAVGQWFFQPATLNGQAIEQETQITMKFHP